MEISDEEIIGQVKGGHKQAFTVLVERYQSPIFNLMYRYSRSDHDAADLTQEVFIRAYEKLGTFKPGGSFFSWMYTLAVNRANDWRRRQQTMAKYRHVMQAEKADQYPKESRQERDLLQQEDLQQLETAMQELNDDTREILILRYRYDCSVRETAEIFSISESAVKMRTTRGLKQLQDLLQGEDYEK